MAADLYIKKAVKYSLQIIKSMLHKCCCKLYLKMKIKKRKSWDKLECFQYAYGPRIYNYMFFVLMQQKKIYFNYSLELHVFENSVGTF